MASPTSRSGAVATLPAVPTIAAALAWATAQLHGVSETPRLDAELLLGHALGWGRARVMAELPSVVPAAALHTFRDLVARRMDHEPVAYLTGRKEFFGLEFLVDRRVLVPRPETETLVELALEWAREWRRFHPAAGPLVIADVGTGSGCIAIALAVHLPDARVYAIDLSPGALDMARQNIARHAVAGRVTLLQGDLLAPLPQPVDLLASNPPYTILAEIDEGVRRHEPHLALDGGVAGLDVYRRLLATAPAALRPGGAALLEIGAAQAAAVTAMARAAFPTAQVMVRQDLAGRDRVVMVQTQECATSAASL